jgi:hypothetical protein
LSNIAPCNEVEYGSGGIVSNGSDMLNFLLYNMSPKYPASLHKVQSGLPAVCNPSSSPQVGFGWFQRSISAGYDNTTTVVCKDGGVTGFSSWIAFQLANEPSPCGLFVLTNGPDAVTLGLKAFKILLAPASARWVRALPCIAEPASDGSVH